MNNPQMLRYSNLFGYHPVVDYLYKGSFLMETSDSAGVQNYFLA
jgi:hypothetical protein